MGRIILASSSPRRKAILELMGINGVCVISPECDESVFDEKNMAVGELVAALSRLKAASVMQTDEDDTVIAADTVVSLGGRILGKPADEAEAFEMLRLLSGKWHEVFTGLCVVRGAREVCAHDVTRVLMRELDDDEIRAYIKTGEPMDKAGAYGAQGRGCVLVERVDGDYFNVVGLPVPLLYKTLRDFGVMVI